MPNAAERPEIVDVRESGRGKFAFEIEIGPNTIMADEPDSLGGNDLGPRPHELVLAGLGACTAMTLRMYADRKGIPLKGIGVHLSHRKIKAADCPDCTTTEGEVEEMVEPLDQGRLVSGSWRSPTNVRYTRRSRARSRSGPHSNREMPPQHRSVTTAHNGHRPKTSYSVACELG